MPLIDFEHLTRYLDATVLGTGARREVPELEEWVEENPALAARYIALMRSYLEE